MFLRRGMRKRVIFFTILLSVSCQSDRDKAIKAEVESLRNCAQMIKSGIRPIATTRDQRFQGKVEDSTAACRGGDVASQFRAVPWVDWSNYWGAGDAKSKAPRVRQTGGPFGAHGARHRRRAARSRIPAHRADQVQSLRQQQAPISNMSPAATACGGPGAEDLGRDAAAAEHPNYRDVGGAGEQVCKGDLIRGRTLTGICNDMRNPLMGSTGTLFARNVEFETHLPRSGPHRAHAQPARRPPGAAEARSAGDQPQAVHARAIEPRRLQRRLRPAGLLEGRELRLQEGAVLQRAGRVLDPVHDARLVLAPGGRPQRDRVHERRLRRVDAGAGREAAAAVPATASTRRWSPKRRRPASSRTTARSTWSARPKTFAQQHTPPGGTLRRSTATTSARASA